MKKQITKLMAAIMLLVTFCIPMGMNGQAPVNTVLWGETWGTFTSQVNPSNYNQSGTSVYNNATVTYAQSSTSTKLYNEALAGGTAAELLLAKNNGTWTITGIPSGSATELTLTFKANYDRTVVSSSTSGITIGTKTFSNKTVTYPITVASTVSTFELVFTNTESSNVRIDNIELVVTTAGSGGGSNLTTSDLAITSQSSALTFDLYNNSTAQTITYSTSSTGAISITPASPTSYFSYVHDANNQTITVTPIAVTPSAQTVTISQEADATYNAGSASFTVSVANSAPLANIAALTANTTAGTYNVALSNAVVTYVDGNYAYIQDASGAVVYYKSGHGLTAGDVLTGTATVAYQLRNSNPQITDLTGVTPVSGTAPSPVTVAQSAWNYTFNDVLSQYFQVTGATITQSNNKYYVSLNNESIQLYKVGTAISGLDLTKTYTITGFPTLYNTVKELQIFEAPQVEVSGSTIIVTPATLASFTYEEGDGPSTTKTLSVEGANLTADITVSLTDGQNSDFELSLTENGTYTNTLTLTQNSGAVAATTVYVRMKAGLSVNANAYEDDITIASTGATSVTVNLTGTVTVPVGPHVTWDLTTNSYDADPTEQLVTWSSAYATMTNAKGTGTAANNYLGGDANNRTSSRFYSGNVWTLTPAVGYAITSVELTATSSGYASAFAGSTWTNATASTVGSTVTVTPTDGANAISAVVGGTCGFTSVTVYYTQHVVQSYNLTVSALSNVDMFVFDYDDQTETLIEGGATAQTEEVQEGTHVLVSVAAVSGYALATFTVDGVDHLADIEDYEFDFIMPSHNVTITATAVPAYTIMFSVNGQEWAAAQMELTQGQALGTLPVPANIPAGFNFVGWMESPAHPYYNATTAPTMVNAQTVPNDDMILDAVFCIGEIENGGWTLSNTAPEDEDEVILATEDSGDYYAFFANGNSASATPITVANNIITNASETVWTASDATTTISGEEYSGLAFSRDEVNGFLHFNSGAIKVANGYTNGLFEFTGIQGTSAFTMYSFLNGRYLTYDNGFGVSADEEDACPVYVFKYIAGNATYTDYTTLVVNHADNTTIADNAAETLYGIHYINGYVLAGDNVTNNGKLVVTTNGELDMYGSTLTNNNAANFLIEDGGKYQGNSVAATMQKVILPYSDQQGVNDKWYAIAHPFTQGINPGYNNYMEEMVTDVAGEYSYDFYRFDNRYPEAEWRNFRADDFGMTVGQGYLYAHKHGITLNFTGTLNATYNNGQNATVTSVGFGNAANYNNFYPFADYFFAGNPFSCDATIVNFSDFFVLNEAGTEFIPTEDGILAPMQGAILYDAQAPTTNNGYTISYTAGHGDNPEIIDDGELEFKKALINLNVSKNRGEKVDRARVRFGEGAMLGKFQLNPNSTKIYFTQNGKDYAVVRSNGQGELPVNFKAGSNGTYTLNVEAKNVEMNYLHIIDNMTGNDVDLLQNPNYTFEANPSDYASRFRLVFNANTGVNENTETFAFFNGSEWVISNQGDATLQVIDVMGRVLSNQQVNGNAAVKLNQSAGVYMLRLINGNNVMTQKIVVR